MGLRRSFLGQGIALVALGLGLQGCRSLALRYSTPSVAESQHSPSEMDQILAKDVERLSPSYLDKPLRAIRVVAPDYPMWVSREHSGSVMVTFMIDPKGVVAEVRPRAEDNPELVKLITEAMATWRFESPIRDGQPTSVYMRLPFRFVVE